MVSGSGHAEAYIDTQTLVKEEFDNEDLLMFSSVALGPSLSRSCPQFFTN